MPRTRDLPDTVELQALLRQGASQADIARRYGVTRQAVSKALAASHLRQPRHSFKPYAPWKVRTVHQNAYQLRMLRLHGREQMGLPIAEGDKRQLEAFRARLDELDVVVDYDREEGFFYVPREEGDTEYHARYSEPDDNRPAA